MTLPHPFMNTPRPQTANPSPLAARCEILVALALFTFLAFLYLLFFSGVSHNPDEWFYLHAAETAMRGDLGSVPSHGRLFSLLLSPLYWLSTALPRVGMMQVTALLNNLLTPLTAAVLYLCLGELYAGRGARLFTALAFALATFSWPHSRYLLREPMTALLLLVSLWGAIRFWRRPSLASLAVFVAAFALLLVTKTVAMALLPFFGVLLVIPLLRRWAQAIDPARHPRLYRLVQRWQAWRTGLSQRDWFGWLAPLGVVGLLLVIVFVAGRIPLPPHFIPTYQAYLREHGVNLPNTLALWFSPGWGMLVYAPVLWISVIGLASFIRRYPAIAFAALGGSVAFTMAASPHPYWWGNWAFGPRQMVLLLPLLCLPMPAGLEWLRARLGAWGMAIAAGLMALGVVFQVIGMLAPYGQYVREVYFPAGVEGPDVAWDLSRWPIAGLARFLRPELLDWAWIAGREPGNVAINGPVALTLAALALTSGLWLAYVMRVVAAKDGNFQKGCHLIPARLWIISLALALLWSPVAVRAVQSAYLDPRFQPELGFLAAAEVVRSESRPGDLLLTDLWTEQLTGPAEAMLNYCRGGCPPRTDLTREALVDREEDWETARLEDLAGYQRAWLVLDRVMEGDPNSIVEQWLGQVGYLQQCQWTGPQVRLCLYSLEPGVVLQSGPVEGAFGDNIALESAEVRLAGSAGIDTPPAQAAPGDTLQVELKWAALAAPQANYNVSLQLLGPDGALVAAADRTPGNGFRPTATWQAGEQVVDRFALAVPAGAAPGVYQLRLVLYDPATGQRLPVQLAGAPAGDSLLFQELSMTP